MTKYYFSIKTKDEYLAGTDSNIFIKLFGERGISKEVRTNTYISENAYERDEENNFDIDFDDDYGDIYKIELRSDMMWAGADWMCESVKVNKTDHSASIFYIDQWISDKDTHPFIVSSGFSQSLPEALQEYKLIHGVTHYIPAYVEAKLSCSTSLSVSVDYNSVTVNEVGLTAKIEVEYAAVKAALETMLKQSVERQIGESLNSTITRSTEITIPSTERPRMLTETWTERDLNFKAVLGSDNYSFAIPQDRVFSGFKENPCTPEEFLKISNTTSRKML